MNTQTEVDKLIKNEMRIIDKVRENGGHSNIITILNYGRLNEERYYFDMELCILNLEDYILGDFKSILGNRKYYYPDFSRDTLSCLSLWGILSQIAQGLEFLHVNNEMHRDLKPRNGTISELLSLLSEISFPKQVS